MEPWSTEGLQPVQLSRRQDNLASRSTLPSRAMTIYSLSQLYLWVSTCKWHFQRCGVGVTDSLTMQELVVVEGGPHSTGASKPITWTATRPGNRVGRTPPALHVIPLHRLK